MVPHRVHALNLAIALLGLLLGGCAKFPAGGSAAGNTRIQFYFKLAQPVNPSYIYLVAIRVLTPPVGTDTSLSDPNQGPIPVVDTGSKNGIVQGLPTHYVIYNPADTNGLYQVYRFPTRAEEGSSADPSDPAAMDLRWPGIYVGDVLPGSALDPTTYSDGTELGFSIDTSYLDQHAASAQSIQTIQVNFLTMNVPATSAANVALPRVIDAIGDQHSLTGSTTFNNPIQISLLNSSPVASDGGSTPETAGDTYPSTATLPSVDLVKWSVTCTPP